MVKGEEDKEGEVRGEQLHWMGMEVDGNENGEGGRGRLIEGGSCEGMGNLNSNRSVNKGRKSCSV